MPNHEVLPFSALPAPTSTTHRAGDVLFYEGDPADALIVLEAGRAVMHKNSEPCGEIVPGTLLDWVATLGGLRHSVKITLLEDSVCQRWPLENVWKNDVFAAAARRYLAAEVQRMQTRLDEVDAPVHYANP
ncbi:MAG TPA: cyclic nucleotide-binding domain-containing protein, partial [Aggregatilineaceae bacterium]|nr:cyclic nucleotide-binding domain-containing protein [Aggregatilineaceae bacterium]